ncbi:MAG: hypothetical protein AAGF95_14660 [Chloroflexota bacterium]
MEAFLTFLTYVGYVSTIIVIISSITGVVLWARGILPVLLRLGNGLANSKIAVFARADNLSSIKNLLLDSGLFLEKNIVEISTKKDMGRAEGISLYIASWSDWENEIDAILSQKGDKTALMIYAPPGSIPPDQMANLDEKRNVAVANFRGRLLTDIIVSIITRSSTR